MEKKAKRGKPSKKTEHEKRLRANAKKRLQLEGIIPPNKPRLNREKFCKEAHDILAEQDILEFAAYLYWGLFEILQSGKNVMTGNGRSLEAIGAAKAIKLAARRKKLEKERQENGDFSAYKVEELYEACKEILEA